MDYRAMAEQLVDLQLQLHQAPASRRLAALDRGASLALGYLMDHHKAAHPKELVQGMSVSSARIAALVKHLEEQGLVQRSHDPEDCRQVIVSLTEAGERLIRKRRVETVEAVARALERLGPEDAAAYLRLRAKLVRSLQEP